MSDSRHTHIHASQATSILTDQSLISTHFSHYPLLSLPYPTLTALSSLTHPQGSRTRAAEEVETFLVGHGPLVSASTTVTGTGPNAEGGVNLGAVLGVNDGPSGSGRVAWGTVVGGMKAGFGSGDQPGGGLPGWNETIEVPPEFEPPYLDQDEEILPSKIHPSFPLGRPATLAHPPTSGFTRISLSRARGRQGPEIRGLLRRLGLAPNALRNTRTLWSDFALLGPPAVPHPMNAESVRPRGRPSDGRNDTRWGVFAGLLEDQWEEEIPPQMAGTKRPRSPSPPRLMLSIGDDPEASNTAGDATDEAGLNAAAPETSNRSRRSLESIDSSPTEEQARAWAYSQTDTPSSGNRRTRPRRSAAVRASERISRTGA